MEPSVLLTCLDTPSLPCAATPPGAAQALAGSKVHALGAAALRYLVKFSVVPESSARCTAWIARAGRVTPEFSAAMAGSFQVLMVPLKIPANTAGVNVRLSTPAML